MIIGITGTLGAGKGTVAEYLTNKHGFVYFSVKNFLAQEVLRQGKMVNRDTLTVAANELRAKHGSGYIIEQLMTQALSVKISSVVIESIRSIGEAQYLKSHGATLWAVDAELRTRYNRIVKRASDKDSVSFEKFQEQEEREMSSNDPNNQNLAAVRNMADVLLMNDGTRDELFEQVEAALQKAGV
ncbi:MAG: AAA family ATPase [Patescibacteria group bacterium]